MKLDENIALQELEKIAKTLIPQGRSRDRHNALMDYGAMHLTARKTKIKSLGKQTKFEGSDREVRGWILKQLTKRKITPYEQDTPSSRMHLRFQTIEQEFPQKNIALILSGMQKEQLIRRENDQIRIE